MAYTPNEWVCGETITAEKLNKLERGVQSIMSDYVPTVWQCGDVITAERLNKLEQAVADFECGGGSSDFSTAQVAIITDSNDPTTGELTLLNVFNDDDDGVIHSVPTANAYTTTYTVVLYQNLLQIYDDNEDPIIKSTTGAIELVDEEGTYAITGDCSITVKQFSFS